MMFKHDPFKVLSNEELLVLLEKALELKVDTSFTDLILDEIVSRIVDATLPAES